MLENMESIADIHRHFFERAHLKTDILKKVKRVNLGNNRKDHSALQLN